MKKSVGFNAISPEWFPPLCTKLQTNGFHLKVEGKSAEIAVRDLTGLTLIEMLGVIKKN